MELISIYALMVLTILGVRVCYTDLRFGKIYNKDLQWGLTAALLSFVLYAGVGTMKNTYLSLSYVQTYGYNALLSLLIAYLFWSKGVWAAGDGKLFFVVTLLVPLSWYQHSYFSVYPSFALLLNVILPLVLFVLGRLCLLLFAPGTWQQFREGFQRESLPMLLWAFMQFLGMYLVGKMVLRGAFAPLRDIVRSASEGFLGYFLHDGMLLVVSLLLALQLMRLLRTKMVLYYGIGGCFVLGGAVSLWIGSMSWGDVGNLLFSGLALFMIGLMLLRVSLVKLLLFLRVEGVPLDELQLGMIITPAAKKQLLEKDAEYFQTLALSHRGLDEEQVQGIQSWYAQHCPPREGRAVESIEMYQTTAFGPFIMLGVLITYVLGGALGYVWW